MSKQTPDRQARDDLMILGLRQAIDNGFSFATPGSNDAVRAAFPESFATSKQSAEVSINDDLEVDEYALISRGDDGYWVSAWVWVSQNEDDKDDEGKTCDCCGKELETDEEIKGCPNGQEICVGCFEAGHG